MADGKKKLPSEAALKLDPRIIDQLVKAAPASGAPVERTNPMAWVQQNVLNDANDAFWGNVERARKHVAEGRSVNAAGAYIAAPLGGAVGAVKDVTVDPLAGMAGYGAKFLSGLTGIGEGSGGELPPSAQEQTGQGAPESARPLTARPPSTQGPAAEKLLPGIAAAKALGMKTVSLRQLEALSKLVADPGRPAQGKDAVINRLAAQSETVYANDIEAANKITDPTEAAAAIRAAQEAHRVRMIEAITNLNEIAQAQAVLEGK